MAKRTKRTTRIASAALLGSTIFANPAPAADKKAEPITNRPNPGYDRKRVDAGTPTKLQIPPPGLIINTMEVPKENEQLLLPDGGAMPVKR